MALDEQNKGTNVCQNFNVALYLYFIVELNSLGASCRFPHLFTKVLCIHKLCETRAYKRKRWAVAPKKDYFSMYKV